MMPLRIITLLFFAVTYSIITELEGLNTNSKNARRRFVKSAIFTTVTALLPLEDSNSAPPYAVMAEKTGYFSVYDKRGDLIYLPKRVTRESSLQAIDLAKHLKKENIVLYGAYWCPHCTRQKELFGREAWQIMAAKNYVECDARGNGGNPSMCRANEIDGFPSWKKGRQEFLRGDVSLSKLAEASNYPGVFNADLELNIPSLLVGSISKWEQK